MSLSPQGNLSDYECSVYKEAFALFDEDLSGTIEPAEFVAVLTRLGCKCTESEVIELLGMEDAGAAARITYPMFLEMYQHDDREDLDLEADEAFRILTGAAEGHVSTKNCIDFLKNVNLEITQEEAKLLVSLGDQEGDGDGKFGLADFKAQYRKE